MFRLFECCALSFFERFVLSFSLKIERFVSDSAEIWICGLYMFRYADVLLAKAEAMNELNGPSEEAIEWVNQIRRRANATEIKLVDFNKDTFRDFILDERGRELYCEGHRRDDLIRHGKYIEYARKDGMDAKDYHILFPIPQKALNENSNLKQNPGYEN